MSLLEIENAEKQFAQETGLNALLTRDRNFLQAVNGVDLTMGTGEIFGLVGESGCGKTTLAKLVMKLHELSSGDIKLHGRSITDYDRKEYYRNVQMIFQDPFKSLNPQVPIREQLKEPLEVHSFDNHDDRIYEALEFARLTPPEQYLDKFPHQLSGGEKQRVAIASALVLEPSLIVADEPVSMLDVSVRAGVLDIFTDLAREFDVGILYISHDIATVSYLCDELGVMYLGKLMERGRIEDLIDNPTHPYTERLLRATPEPDPSFDRERVISEEQVPDAVDLPEGCFFKCRCPYRVEACDSEDMHLRSVEGEGETTRDVACHRAVANELEW